MPRGWPASKPANLLHFWGLYCRVLFHGVVFFLDYLATTTDDTEMPKTTRLCKAAGCEKPAAKARHYCSDACRFWSRVDRSRGPDACWIWRGHVNAVSGYGHASSTLTAHRWAWSLTYGDPGELCVLHRCDNRPCCNPRHLFLGTKGHNWRDSVTKGRQTVIVSGEGNSKGKLTAADVMAIRRSPARTRDLVREYPVNAGTIHDIRSRRTWRHIPDVPLEYEVADLIFLTGVIDRIDRPAAEA